MVDINLVRDTQANASVLWGVEDVSCVQIQKTERGPVDLYKRVLSENEGGRDWKATVYRLIIIFSFCSFKLVYKSPRCLECSTAVKTLSSSSRRNVVETALSCSSSGGNLSSWNVNIIFLRHINQTSILWFQYTSDGCGASSPSNFQNIEELMPDAQLSAAVKALHITSGLHRWAESSEAVINKNIPTGKHQEPKPVHHFLFFSP